MTTTTDQPTTLSCGHPPQPTPIFPGYAITSDKRRICPDCADSEQREEMRTTLRFTAYISSDDSEVTTWTGGRLGRILTCYRNRTQTWIRVVDTHGNHWAGIGPAENGTYVNLRRVKG